MTTPTQLLTELETLNHKGRVKRMVALGQASLTDETIQKTLATLAADQTSYYPRYMALFSCFGSRNGTQVLAALADASALVRGLAIKLVSLVCTDEEVVIALEKAAAGRRQLMSRLATAKRQAPLDTFLEKFAQNGGLRDALDKLLPFGSEKLIRRYQARILASADQVIWGRISRLQPHLAAQLLQAEADNRQEFDPRLLRQLYAALPNLAKQHPDEALKLVRSLVRYTPLDWLPVQPLMVTRPVGLLDLVLTSTSKIALDFSTRANRLGVGRLIKWVQYQPAALSYWQRWLTRFRPDERAAIFQTLRFGWQDGEGAIPPGLIALLPQALRHEEGRRHSGLAALTTRPAQRLPYASFLPWDEARAILDPFIRNPDPELRTCAIAALVAIVRYERRHTGEMLEMVKARRNEQDPVRLVMLRGLAALPPGMWQAEHLESLGQIIRDGLDAADLSTNSAHAISELIIRLLPFHSEWSTKWLATLVKEQGQINFYWLERRLTGKQVKEIAPLLLPVLKDWATRERENYLIYAASGFGKRLKEFSGIFELLENLLKDTKSPWVAEMGLGLIARHRHEEAARLIPALLKEDSSWATRHVVYQYLHRHRQDLLTPYLGQASFSGRFSTGRTRFVLPVTRGFERWTPSQQIIFAGTLEDVTRDSARDTPTLEAVIGQLAALPAAAPTRLAELAALDNPKPALRDTTLRRLSHLDSGQGVPILIEALGDERSRIAIYALRKALLVMSAEQVLPLLKTVPLDRVTVAKEVVRLMGELATEEAYQELLAKAQQDNLHRDIRVALMRALWSYLDRAETWEIMDEAAVSPDPAIATASGRIPAEGLSAAGQTRLVELLAKLLVHPDPKVRIDTLVRCAQLPVADGQKLLLPALQAALASPLPDEYRYGAQALFATYTGEGASVIVETLKQIMPLRRNLQMLIEQLQNRLSQNRAYYLTAGRLALAGLASDRLTLNLQIELAVRVLNSEELAEFFTKLATRSELQADGLATALKSIGELASYNELTELEKLESLLSASPDASLRRLALAVLLAQTQLPNGWDDVRRSRLQIYQSDPSAMVAAAAQFVFPPLV